MCMMISAGEGRSHAVAAHCGSTAVKEESCREESCFLTLHDPSGRMGGRGGQGRGGQGRAGQGRAGEGRDGHIMTQENC